MTDLLPDVVVDRVRDLSVMDATGTFGVVAIILLLAVLLQRELARLGRAEATRGRMLSAMAGPLFVAVALVVGVRFVSFIG